MRRKNPRQTLPDEPFLLVEPNRREDAGRFGFVLGVAGEDPDGLYQVVVLGFIEALDLRAGSGDLGAYFQRERGRPTALFVVLYSGAKRGYGPAVYDAVSIFARDAGLGPLGFFPDQQSESAKRLWDKNKTPQEGLFGDLVTGWAPVTKTEFRARYDVPYARLIANGEKLDTWERSEALRRGWQLYAFQ